MVPRTPVFSYSLWYSQLLPQEEAVMGKGEDKTHNKREEGARGGKRTLLRIWVDRRMNDSSGILISKPGVPMRRRWQGQRWQQPILGGWSQNSQSSNQWSRDSFLRRANHQFFIWFETHQWRGRGWKWRRTGTDKREDCSTEDSWRLSWWICPSM